MFSCPPIPLQGAVGTHLARAEPSPVGMAAGHDSAGSATPIALLGNRAGHCLGPIQIQQGAPHPTSRLGVPPASHLGPLLPFPALLPMCFAFTVNSGFQKLLYSFRSSGLRASLFEHRPASENKCSARKTPAAFAHLLEVAPGPSGLLGWLPAPTTDVGRAWPWRGARRTPFPPVGAFSFAPGRWPLLPPPRAAVRLLPAHSHCLARARLTRLLTEGVKFTCLYTQGAVIFRISIKL